MKAILLSVKPQHLANILNGKKTIELRKSKLPLNVPVYLYCITAKNRKEELTFQPFGMYHSPLKRQEELQKEQEKNTMTMGEYELPFAVNGKVVAKCVFSEVIDIDNVFYLTNTAEFPYAHGSWCLNYGRVYSKHYYKYIISNLEIFDTPKELSEFNRCDGFIDCCKCKYYSLSNNMGVNCKYRPLTKAPQSWCYVEVKE